MQLCPHCEPYRESLPGCHGCALVREMDGKSWKDLDTTDRKGRRPKSAKPSKPRKPPSDQGLKPGPDEYPALAEATRRHVAAFGFELRELRTTSNMPQIVAAREDTIRHLRLAYGLHFSVIAALIGMSRNGARQAFERWQARNKPKQVDG